MSFVTDEMAKVEIEHLLGDEENCSCGKVATHIAVYRGVRAPVCDDSGCQLDARETVVCATIDL